MNQLSKIMLKNFLIISNLITITKTGINNNYSNKYNNLYTLGDKLFDTGAFAQYQGKFEESAIDDTECEGEFGRWWPKQPFSGEDCSKKIIKEWKPKIFAKPFYQNSFSNGPVVSQVLADLLNIKTFTSGSYSQDEIDNFGFNYATSDAKVLNSKELLSFEFYWYAQEILLKSERYTLEKQVQMLKYHHPKINDRDLLVINIGSVDISEIVHAIALYDNILWKNFFMTCLNKVIATIFTQLKVLIDHGFKHIVIANAPDFSEVPRYVSNLQLKTLIQEAVKKYNEFFDVQYYALIKNPHFKKKIRKFDAFTIFEEIFNDFKLNNKIVKTPAVEINLLSSIFFSDIIEPYYINEANESNINNYVFFDDICPTASFHNQLGQKIYNFVSNWS